MAVNPETIENFWSLLRLLLGNESHFNLKIPSEYVVLQVSVRLHLYNRGNKRGELGGPRLIRLLLCVLYTQAQKNVILVHWYIQYSHVYKSLWSKLGRSDADWLAALHLARLTNAAPVFQIFK